MNIKKILYLIGLIPALGSLLTACGDSDFDLLNPSMTPRELSASVTAFNFTTPGAQTQKFIITSSKTPWNITDFPNWVALKPASGVATSEVSLSVAQNTSVDSRSAIFYLNSTADDWKFQQELTVSQVGDEPNLTVSTKDLSFGGKASSQTVDVVANFEWSAKSSQSWISLQKSEDGKELEISVTENTGYDYRTGQVTLNMNSTTYATITVTQSIPGIDSPDMLLNFRSSASKYDITVDAEIEWTATVSASWIQVSPTAGSAGKTNVTVEVTPNDGDSDRQGYISFVSGSIEYLRIQVIQKGIHMDAVSSHTFPSAGGTHVFDYTADRPWTARIEGDASWLSLSSTSGSGEQEIVMTATANNTLQERSATVIITPEGYNEIMINLTQSGKYLQASVNSISFFAKGGVSEAVTIDTDSEFTMSQTGNWFSVDMLSDNVFTVTAQANPTSDMRTGSIKLSMQGLVTGSFDLEIPVTQTGEGGSFIIDGYPEDADWNSASSGSFSITVTGFSEDQSWN